MKTNPHIDLEHERLKINLLLEQLLPDLAEIISTINQPQSEMICLEGLSAGVLVNIAVRYNLDPNRLVKALQEGIAERVNYIIYGEKQ